MAPMADKKPRSIAATAAHRRAQQRERDTLDALHKAIAEDLGNGVLQKTLVEITGYSREHIRQIAKAYREARQ